MRDGCPFCDYDGPSEILARYMPRSPEIYGMTFAIEPINPVVSGHVLVVPEFHVEDAGEDYEVTAFTFRCAAEWAKSSGLESYNLITSAGAPATQTVGHLHVHVVPRREGDGLLLPWSDAEGALGAAQRGLLRALDYRAATPEGLAIKADVRSALRGSGFSGPMGEVGSPIPGQERPA